MEQYKLNGIIFGKEKGETICTINQNGISASYILKKAEIKHPVKYVMMDLDGTTVKSEEFWVYLIEKTVGFLLKDKNFRISNEDLPFVSGFTTYQHLSYCINKYCIQESIEKADGIYHKIASDELNKALAGRGNASAFRPREGLKEFLTELKALNIKTGLATSGLDYKAIPEIISAFKAIGMGSPLEYYDAIITGGKRKERGEYGTIGEIASKPHPWMYAELGLGLGVCDKGEAVVIEDSSSGVLSGRLAGYSVIGFNDGNIVQSGVNGLCCLMASDFNEIMNFLKKTQ